VYDLAATTAAIDDLDLQVPAGVQVSMRLDARTVVERAARWFVLSRPVPLDVTRQLAYFTDPVRRVVDALPDLLTGRSLADAQKRRDTLMAEGVPEPLARHVAVLPASFAALSVVDIANRTGADLLGVMRVHLAAGELFDLGRLQQRVLALPRDDRWQTMARAALRDDLYSAHAAITEAIVSTTTDDGAADRVAAWTSRDPDTVSRARRLLSDVLDEESGDLSRLSVGLRAVRTLLSERDPN
jgi:glutamate dehydrogenase